MITIHINISSDPGTEKISEVPGPMQYFSDATQESAPLPADMNMRGKADIAAAPRPDRQVSQWYDAVPQPAGHAAGSKQIADGGKVPTPKDSITPAKEADTSAGKKSGRRKSSTRKKQS